MLMFILKNGFFKLVKNGNVDDFVKVILIMDIYIKICVVNEEFGSDIVMMVGVVKGLGMIYFNLVIMLVFIICDVNILL